jgi:hypothetical protein
MSGKGLFWKNFGGYPKDNERSENYSIKKVLRDRTHEFVLFSRHSNVSVPTRPLTCPVMHVILNSDALLVRPSIAKIVQAK